MNRESRVAIFGSGKSEPRVCFEGVSDFESFQRALSESGQNYGLYFAYLEELPDEVANHLDMKYMRRMSSGRVSVCFDKHGKYIPCSQRPNLLMPGG